MSTEIETIQPYFSNVLKKFEITDHTIGELSNKYMPLKIEGLNDKDGYKIVKASRMVMKNYRIDVEKRRKEIKADVLKVQRYIDNEAKRITELLSPIEEHLLSQEKWYEEELDKIKQEKELAEAARLQSRVNKLIELGFNFNGIDYICTFDSEPVSVSAITLKTQADIDFDNNISSIQILYNKNKEKLAEVERSKKEALDHEEAERKAESERLIKVKKEQEAEQLRLNEIAIEQAAKELALKSEQDRIENEKRKHEENKRIEADIAEKQKHEAAEKIAKENQRTLDEIMEKERQKRLLPDKKKLENLGAHIAGIIMPEVISAEAIAITVEVDAKLYQIRDYIERVIKHL